MSQLPLDGAVGRFKVNEEKIDVFANGDSNDYYTSSEGVDVPSIQKFLSNKNYEINAAASSILSQATTAKDEAVLAKDAAVVASDVITDNLPAINAVYDIDTEIVAVAAIASQVVNFADIYMGASSTAPSSGMILGSLYFDTVAAQMRAWDGAIWKLAYVPTSGLLTSSNNLSDITSAPAARANLGLNSLVVPAGAIMYFAMSTPPAGWLKANGALLSRTTYADLFTAIGTTYGAGDGSTTFNLPDARGEFLRGWDDGRGVDAGRGFGSAQGHQFQVHEHKVFSRTHGGGSSVDASLIPAVNGANLDGTQRNTLGVVSGNYGSETRPRNIALLACIKF